MEYIKVYDLKDDKETIAQIQHATLNTDHAGLKIEHGLFGAEEWWEAIDKGLFPKKIIEGVISRVYMSGHNDYPTFEVENTKGKTQWTREGDDRYYIPGRKVRIVYILQKFKRRLKSIGENSEVVLTIEIKVGNR